MIESVISGLSVLGWAFNRKVQPKTRIVQAFLSGIPNPVSTGVPLLSGMSICLVCQVRQAWCV